MIYLTYLLVFISGLTGLVYEVTWQKYLGIFMGSHSVATAIILSVFFLFLSIGYWFFGKYTHKLNDNKLMIYGWIEVILGIYTLISPDFFELLHSAFSFHIESPALNLFVQFIFCCLFIGFPTFLMGGTIPVLTQALSSSFNVSHRTHALIYGINTLGAFLGTILAGFVFIEMWGLTKTLQYTGGINILLFVAIFLITRFSNYDFSGITPDPTKKASRISQQTFILYTLAFLSGFYVFSLQNLIIRMTGTTLGSSTYTFSIIVGAYIFAIGLGSLWVSWFKSIVSIRFLVSTQSALLLSTAALFIFIPQWPDLFLRVRLLIDASYMNFFPFWTLVFMILVLILFIPVGLMGVSLPLLFNYIKTEKQHLSESVGKLYSINCLGSTLGAIFGGYAIFYFLDGNAVFKLNLILMAISLCLVISLAKKKQTAILTFTVCLLGIIILPHWQDIDFSPNRYSRTSVPQTVKSFSDHAATLDEQAQFYESVYSEFDPNTYVTVMDHNKKDRILFVNAKPDAHTGMDQTTRALAPLLPLSIAPNKVEEVFIIGLGAGLSTGIATAFKEVKHVEVAEISQGVINSLPYFKDYNYGIEKRPEKYTIHNGDAYKILKGKNKKYDVIICEPSNPWVSGVEKLFSQEFYQQAAKKLNSNGLYAQWFPLFHTDEETFKIILKTFQSVFPYTTVWSAKGMALTLLGSFQPFTPNKELLISRYNENKHIYQNLGLNSPYTILLNQLLNPFMVNAFTHNVDVPHTLLNPILEFKAGKAYFANIHINLDDIVKKTLRLPPPKHFKSTKYIGETLFPEAPIVAYTDQDKLSGSSYKFQKSRLDYMKFKAVEHKTNEQIYHSKLASYLLGNSKKPPFKEGSLKNIETSIEAFESLLYSFEAPQIRSILALFPASCGNSSSCIEGKIKVLERFAPMKFLESMNFEEMKRLALNGDSEAQNLIDQSLMKLARLILNKKKPAIAGSFPLTN